MITPQAGDLWRVSGWIGVINDSDTPSPDKWPESGNIRSNPSWHTEVMTNYWFVYGKTPLMIGNLGDILDPPKGIEDGKGGWELCYRPGWIKLFDNV